MSATVMLLGTLCVVLCLSNLVSLCCCWKHSRASRSKSLLSDNEIELAPVENAAFKPSMDPETELRVVNDAASGKRKGRMMVAHTKKTRPANKYGQSQKDIWSIKNEGFWDRRRRGVGRDERCQSYVRSWIESHSKEVTGRQDPQESEKFS